MVGGGGPAPQHGLLISVIMLISPRGFHLPSLQRKLLVERRDFRNFSRKRFFVLVVRQSSYAHCWHVSLVAWKKGNIERREVRTSFGFMMQNIHLSRGMPWQDLAPYRQVEHVVRCRWGLGFG